MRYIRMSKEELDIKKKRFNEVLDYDSGLTCAQLSERFGIANNVVSTWKKEWREKNEC